MWKDHRFEVPLTPLRASPREGVVSADLLCRIQGGEVALESLPQVAEAIKLGLVQRRPVLGLNV